MHVWFAEPSFGLTVMAVGLTESTEPRTNRNTLGRVGLVPLQSIRFAITAAFVPVPVPSVPSVRPPVFEKEPARLPNSTPPRWLAEPRSQPSSFPSTAIVVPASISSKEELQKLVDETRSQLSRIDILVCNAASNPYYGPMAGISDEQFRKILDNNVLANHWLIAMVAPEMVERKEGSIIIVSSIGGLKGSTMIGAYNVSKAADFQLARNLAAEFGPAGVRVNSIAPGLVKTDFARALWENPETLKAVTMHTPLQRIGEPHEIAGAAVFLAAPASTFMTGQTIIVDGGSTVGVGL